MPYKWVLGSAEMIRFCEKFSKRLKIWWIYGREPGTGSGTRRRGEISEDTTMCNCVFGRRMVME